MQTIRASGPIPGISTTPTLNPYVTPAAHLTTALIHVLTSSYSTRVLLLAPITCFRSRSTKMVQLLLTFSILPHKHYQSKQHTCSPLCVVTTKLLISHKWPVNRKTTFYRPKENKKQNKTLLFNGTKPVLVHNN